VLVLLVAWVWPLPQPSLEAWRARPRSASTARSTYWIGHSLVVGRDEHVSRPLDVVEKVDRLATSLGLEHRAFVQASWGAPLSLHVRGRAHGPDRFEPALPQRLEELENRGREYDTLLLTDTVPLSSARRWEHTDYYASHLACTLWSQRPSARVLLHETWVSLQLPPDSSNPSAWSFSREVRRERAQAELAAAAISQGTAVRPGALGRLTRCVGPTSCEAPSPVLLVPVGTCLARLGDELATDPSWGLELSDFFANPRLGVPARWSADPIAEFARLRLRHPEEPFDDIHGSDLGIYFSALVHAAVLFGDPTEASNEAEGLDEGTARRLRQFVWRCVSEDPDTGVGR
jgi:hypothetical protein